MRILVVNECSVLHTGYGIYGKEIISRLHKDGYEVCELALQIEEGDPRLNDIPWTVAVNNPKDKRDFDNHPQNKYGWYAFDKVCREFHPNVVLDFRDVYMYDFEYYSAYRKYYNWAPVAVIDGIPPHSQWLEVWNNADGLFTLTDWAADILKERKIKVDGVMSQAASSNFFPLSKDKIEKVKKSFGFEEYKIIGTVMRNQPRKLFNELFAGFRKYLDDTGDKALLHCHTAIPDFGWDIPQLLLDYDLSTKVIFTYRCHACGKSFPKFYSNQVLHCPFCVEKAAKLSDSGKGISEQELNVIYNTFDLYVQMANREGFGMPQVEAAATGTPVAFVDYSAMAEVGRKIDGLPIKVLAYNLNSQMKLLEAIPDVYDFCDLLKHFFVNNPVLEPRKAYELNYSSWDETYRPLREYLAELPKVDLWEKPKDIKYPISFESIKDIPSNTDYARALIRYVLYEENLEGSYFMTRLIRDLNVGYFNGSYNYLIEFPLPSPLLHQFDRQAAYNVCLNRRMYLNECEKLR